MISIVVTFVGVIIVHVVTPFIGRVVLSLHPERDPSRDGDIIRWTKIWGTIACVLGGLGTYAFIQAAQSR